MANKDFIKIEGTVTEARPAGRFDIVLENGHKINAVISGKIRKNNIMIHPGDRVNIEMSPYDLSIGRIVHRYKD